MGLRWKNNYMLAQASLFCSRETMGKGKEHFCAVGIHLDVTNRLWIDAMNKSVFQMSVNRPHWLVLRAIVELGDGCTLTEVSNFLYSEISTCSRAIYFLEQNHLITRKATEDDLRVKGLFLTEAGEAIHRGIDNAVEKVREKILQDVSSEQLETFLHVLDKIKNRAEKISKLPSVNHKTITSMFDFNMHKKIKHR